MDTQHLLLVKIPMPYSVHASFVCHCCYHVSCAIILFWGHCRVRHADVLEFVWLLNSHPEVTYTWMHGDKDTYRLGFHLANKSADFAQVCCASLECSRNEKHVVLEALYKAELRVHLGIVWNAKLWCKTTRNLHSQCTAIDAVPQATGMKFSAFTSPFQVDLSTLTLSTVC